MFCHSDPSGRWRNAAFTFKIIPISLLLIIQVKLVNMFHLDVSIDATIVLCLNPPSLSIPSLNLFSFSDSSPSIFRFCLGLWFCFYMKENVWRFSSCIWLVLLNTMVSSSVYFPPNDANLLFLKANKYTVGFSHLFMYCGYLDCCG